MALSGDLRVFTTLGSLPKHPIRSKLPPFKVSGFPTGICNNPEALSKFMRCRSESHHQAQWRWYHQMSAIGDESPSMTSIVQDTEGLVLNAVNMNFSERFSLAWKILFPTPAARTPTRNSNANIAKQRLKMILFADRCAVTEEAKQKIVTNIISALSDFVEIDSRDKVQLSVSADPDLGTLYSVTVPVRRVKPEYREGEEEYTGIANIEYRDTGETSGSVDVRFDFILPGEKK